MPWSRRPTGTGGRSRGFIRARFRWMLLVLLVVMAGAGFLSWSRSPMYRAGVDVMIPPRIYAAATTPQIPDMGTEKAIASSAVVIEAAARSLGLAPSDVSSGLSVSVPLNTHVVHISSTSPRRTEAQRRAQAVADAYVAYWVSQQPAVGTSTSKLAKAVVISPAATPTSPVSPNHATDLAIAFVVGLMLAFGTALIRDKLDDHIRGPGDLIDRGAGPILALVPAIRHGRGDYAAKLVTVRSPSSRSAKAYQDLRTLIFRAATRRRGRTVLVTCPGLEDKTAVAANLAVALAQSGQQVAFVCADLRWPEGHEIFGMPNSAGLAGILDGHIELSDALQDTAVPGLQLLPAGHLEGDYGAALHKPDLQGVLLALRRTADFLVIDAPPVLAGADTGALAELADMVLLVVDARRTTRHAVEAAIGELDHIKSSLIGSVLDNVGRRSRIPRSVSPHTYRPAESASQTAEHDGHGPWPLASVKEQEATHG